MSDHTDRLKEVWDAKDQAELRSSIRQSFVAGMPGIGEATRLRLAQSACLRRHADLIERSIETAEKGIPHDEVQHRLWAIGYLRAASNDVLGETDAR